MDCAHVPFRARNEGMRVRLLAGRGSGRADRVETGSLTVTRVFSKKGNSSGEGFTRDYGTRLGPQRRLSQGGIAGVCFSN